MFDAHYIDWNHKKIKTIINHYGHQAFIGKSVLDLGCGHGDIGAAFSRLGANVTCVDVRQEHLDVLKKKYPHLNTIKADLEGPWPFKNKKFDFILDLSLICHLRNYKEHLEHICQLTENLILESEICDSLDPDCCIYVDEHKSIYDLAYGGLGVKPSAPNIENILRNFGMEFKRHDNSELNSGNFKYNWKVNESRARVIGNRRLWFCKKDHDSVIVRAPQQIPVLNLKATESSPTMPQPINISTYFFPNYSPKEHKSDFKVALCISGHLRAFDLTYDVLYHNFLKHVDCDIFIHTWEHLGTPFRHHDQRAVRLSTYDAMPKINALYKPKKIIIEPYIHFPFRQLMIERNIEHRDLNGMLSMFYKIKMCNELKKQHEQEMEFKYDCVIRYRSDLIINSPFLISKNTNLNKIHFPNFADYNGANDQFAFSNSKNMDIYSSLFDNIEKYLAENSDQYINPEKLLKYHMNKNNLQVLKCNISYSIKRSM